ncbi:MAG: hypothetical protein HC910_21870 [Spirulinaceae cyanobacterium SM2_1_0]|nr:hypothetical protein [Spirulinaceae cyanobacterium SM2_1_0]
MSERTRFNVGYILLLAAQSGILEIATARLLDYGLLGILALIVLLAMAVGLLLTNQAKMQAKR